jgi:hypothetical protein
MHIYTYNTIPGTSDQPKLSLAQYTQQAFLAGLAIQFLPVLTKLNVRHSHYTRPF